MTLPPFVVQHNIMINLIIAKLINMKHTWHRTYYKFSRSGFVMVLCERLSSGRVDAGCCGCLGEGGVAAAALGAGLLAGVPGGCCLAGVRGSI